MLVMDRTDTVDCLVLGADGIIGTAMQSAAPTDASPLIVDFVPRAGGDVRNVAALSELFRRRRPRVVINLAAYNDMNRAERDDRQLCQAINERGAANVAHAAGDVGAFLVHLSSAYVFDGAKSSPYVEIDGVNPISRYGESKALGERLVIESGARALIVRAGWIFALDRRNFLSAIVRQIDRRDFPLRVVGDRIGSPMAARRCVRLLMALATHASGWSLPRMVLHLGDRPAVSRHGFACAVLHHFDPDADLANLVQPVTTSDMADHARRPRNAALESIYASEFGIVAGDWQNDVGRELAPATAPRQ
jgi:dTDP-4-dehydrorhamnose reductase